MTAAIASGPVRPFRRRAMRGGWVTPALLVGWIPCCGQATPGLEAVHAEQMEVTDVHMNGLGFRLVLPGITADESLPSRLTMTTSAGGIRVLEAEFPDDHIHGSGHAVDIWGDSSVHRFRGRTRFPEQDLAIIGTGDEKNRLAFYLLRDVGYVYLCGRGQVILGADTVLIGSDEDGKNVHWTHEVPGLYSTLLVKAAEADDMGLFEHLWRNGGDADTYTAKQVWLPDHLLARKAWAYLALLAERPRYRDHLAPKLQGKHVEAIANGDEQLLRLLIASGMDPDLRNEDGSTVLQAAVKGGRADLIKLLLAKGAHVELEDPSGRTALHYAAGSTDHSMVEQLIISGANVDHPDRSGQSVLMHAAIAGDARMLRTLLNAGANTALTDSSGKTALSHAIEKGDMSTYDLLRADPAAKRAVPAKPNIIAALDSPPLFRHILLKNTERKHARYNGRSLRYLARRTRRTRELMRMDNRFHWQFSGAFQLNFFDHDSAEVSSSVGAGFQLLARLRPRVELFAGLYHSSYHLKGDASFLGAYSDHLTFRSYELSGGLQWNSTHHLTSSETNLYLQIGYTRRRYEQVIPDDEPGGENPNLVPSEGALFVTYGLGDRGRHRFSMEFRYTRAMGGLFVGRDERLNSLTALHFVWGF